MQQRSDGAEVRERLPGTPSPAHRWHGADGVSIAGDSWGDPHGPLVVLLHGGGQTRHAWKGTGALLGAAGCYAIALDARGHGDSDWSSVGDYSPDVMVRDLQAVIAATGRPCTALIGASMGGVTSLIAAGEGMVNAEAVILVDVVPQCAADGVARIKAFMQQKPEGFTSLQEVADAIARYRAPAGAAAAGPAASTQGLAKNLRAGADGRYHWHWDPRLLSVAPDLAQRYKRLASSAQRLRMPVLLVRGARSDVVTDAGVVDFLGQCPHAEVVNVRDASHMVAGDQNDLFGAVAVAFLQRHLQTMEQAVGRTEAPRGLN